MNIYILIISLHADPVMPPGYEDWGGTHTYMKELLDVFCKNHRKAVLITRLSMHHLPEYEKYNDYCTIYRLVNDNKPQNDKLNLIKYHAENYEKICKIINELGEVPTCIHSVYWNSGRIAIELSKNYSVPFVHSVISNSLGRVRRGARQDNPLRATYEREIYHAARCVLCVSQDEKNDLMELYNVPENKLIVAGQYIADSFRQPVHDKNGFPRINTYDEKIQSMIALAYNTIIHAQIPIKNKFWIYKAFVYLGRIDVSKGVDKIIFSWYTLFKKNRNNCPPLWLIGGSLLEISNMHEIIKRQVPDIQELEQCGKIIWWGYLDASGISTILLKSSVLITHSLYEPGGRVVLEAMSEGIPVIATSNGFAKDIIHNWENGFIVQYGDVNMLHKCMEFFLRQPLLSEAMGHNAKISASKYISYMNFEKQHFDAYNISHISTREDSHMADSSVFDVRKKTEINIFPYITHLLSDHFISSLIKKHTGYEAIKIPKSEVISTSQISEYLSNGTRYISKQFLTRMSTSPLYNPILKTEYGRYSYDSFRRESYIYHRLELPYYVAENEENCLLILKKIKTVPITDEEYLRKCIQHIYYDYDVLSDNERTKSYELFNIAVSNVDEIENYILCLRNTFPDLQFEATGFFSPHICWKIAEKILDYDNEYLSETDKLFFKKTIQLFNDTNFFIKEKEFRLINVDASPEHFLYDGNSICPIDFERMSIGPIESMIAAFLYHFMAERKTVDISITWNNICDFMTEYKVNEKLLVSMLAYRATYETLRKRLLQLSSDTFDIGLIKCISEYYEKNSYIVTTSR